MARNGSSTRGSATVRSIPLPLVFGTYEQSGFTYELRPSSFDPHGWRLEHDPRGAFVGADFAAAPARTEQFLEMHQELSTSPTSGFVRIADDHAPHRRGASKFSAAACT